MIKNPNHITVFEHETLYVDRGHKSIPPKLFEALVTYHGEGLPYYSLGRNSIKFNEHVGVIQVGKYLIEVLPKADRPNADTGEKDENHWRDILIGMLRAVGSFNIQATSTANLKIKPNSILDLYFELFVNETEYLLHNGLIKQYRKAEGNITSLKGNLHFAKHISQNLVHQERFYTRHTVYDVNHKLHHILYKTICLLKQINTNNTLQGRISVLLLNFPEMPDIKVTESTFDKITFNRKNHSYKNAINISRLLLLQYHPDLSGGKNNVLALMFNMNTLWEKFVYASIRKHENNHSYTTTAQTTTDFWKPDGSHAVKIKPDISIRKGDDHIILDTKWKNIGDGNPSASDLQQMFAYHEFFKAKTVALVCPGNLKHLKGAYTKLEHHLHEKTCLVITIAPDNIIINDWQKAISEKINRLISPNE